MISFPRLILQMRSHIRITTGRTHTARQDMWHFLLKYDSRPRHSARIGTMYRRTYTKENLDIILVLEVEKYNFILIDYEVDAVPSGVCTPLIIFYINFESN